MKKIATILLLIISFTISSAFAEEDKYTCPMHPHYISDTMGACPICGMDLVPLSQEESINSSDAGGKGGRAIVTISPEMIQNTGIQTEKAHAARFGTDVRAMAW